MNIKLHEISVRDLVSGYADKGDEGVVGYGGKLDIRPAYQLVADSDVQKKSGIWEYVLDGDERHLGIRAFDDNTRLEAYERQHGVCPLCGAHFELNEMEADHITPWRDGGRTIPANCQMFCRDCNRRKGAK